MCKISIESLSSYLARRPDVICVYIFGSGQDGCIHEGSDLDLGVLLRRKLSPEDKIQLMTEIAEAADFDIIDLVDLHDAPPILAFEALSGRCICKNDPAATAAFTSITCREYESVMARLTQAA